LDMPAPGIRNRALAGKGLAGYGPRNGHFSCHFILGCLRLPPLQDG